MDRVHGGDAAVHIDHRPVRGAALVGAHAACALVGTAGRARTQPAPILEPIHVRPAILVPICRYGFHGGIAAMAGRAPSLGLRPQSA